MKIVALEDAHENQIDEIVNALEQTGNLTRLILKSGRFN